MMRAIRVHCAECTMSDAEELQQNICLKKLSYQTNYKTKWRETKIKIRLVINSRMPKNKGSMKENILGKCNQVP